MTDRRAVVPQSSDATTFRREELWHSLACFKEHRNKDEEFVFSGASLEDE